MDRQLEDLKDIVKTLYMSEHKTLQDVMDHIRTEYGLVRSKAVYERHLKEWGFRKNTKNFEWNWVDHKFAKRKSAGKASNLYIRGRFIPQSTIRKEISRNVTTLQQITRATAHSPQTPHDYKIVTPGVNDYYPDGESANHSASSDATREKGDLAKIMQDCGCFITLWGTQGRVLHKKDFVKEYARIAEELVSGSSQPGLNLSSLPDSSDYSVGYQVLLSSYQNDDLSLQHLVDHQLTAVHNDVVRTARFLVSHKGHFEAAGALFSHSMGIDSRDAKGFTCLHTAASKNHPKLVGLLLKKNASISQKNHAGETAFSNICGSEDHEEVSELLIHAGADLNVTTQNLENPLYCAAAGGHIQEVRTMLRRGMNPSIQTPFEWCPLHWAAANGHYEVVKLLVEAGANVNCVSDTRKTPLDLLGQRCDRAEIRQYLLNNAATTATETRPPARGYPSHRITAKVSASRSKRGTYSRTSIISESIQPPPSPSLPLMGPVNLNTLALRSPTVPPQNTYVPSPTVSVHSFGPFPLPSPRETMFNFTSPVASEIGGSVLSPSISNGLQGWGLTAQESSLVGVAVHSAVTQSWGEAFTSLGGTGPTYGLAAAASPWDEGLGSPRPLYDMPEMPSPHW